MVTTPRLPKSLRVAWLIYRGNPHCGGQGVYTKYIAREAIALGHHVEVLSGPPYPELDDRVNRLLFAEGSSALLENDGESGLRLRRELFATRLTWHAMWGRRGTRAIASSGFVRVQLRGRGRSRRRS